MCYILQVYYHDHTLSYNLTGYSSYDSLYIAFLSFFSFEVSTNPLMTQESILNAWKNLTLPGGRVGGRGTPLSVMYGTWAKMFSIHCITAVSSLLIWLIQHMFVSYSINNIYIGFFTVGIACT